MTKQMPYHRRCHSCCKAEKQLTSVLRPNTVKYSFARQDLVVTSLEYMTPRQSMQNPATTQKTLSTHSTCPQETELTNTNHLLDNRQRGHLHISNWPTKKLDKTAHCTPWPFPDAHTLHCVVTGWASGLLKAPARGGQAIGHLLTENNKMSATSTFTAFDPRTKQNNKAKKTMTTPVIVHFTCTCHRATWTSCVGWKDYRQWCRELITCNKTWLGIFL